MQYLRSSPRYVERAQNRKQPPIKKTERKISDCRPARDQTMKQLPDSNTHPAGRTSSRRRTDPPRTAAARRGGGLVLPAANPRELLALAGPQPVKPDRRAEPARTAIGLLSPGPGANLSHPRGSVPRVPAPALHLHHRLHASQRRDTKSTRFGIAVPAQQATTATFRHAEICP